MGGEASERAFDHDVVIVGGGPAGCAAGVFTAREGLDTVIYDCGRSSLKQCAYLENYLGFPAGVDIETLYERMHDHAETAGCTIVPDMVQSLARPEEGDGFVVDVRDGESVTARRVVAATRYDGEYMRGLDDDDAMFETQAHHGEEHETFVRSYAAKDGTTPVPALYIASPSKAADKQAIIAAGRGARVARRVITDARVDDGWWEPLASERVDWVRREAALDDAWTERETWVHWFYERYAEAAPMDPDSEHFQRVRDEAIEAARSTYLSHEEIADRAETGQARLASYLDPSAVVAGLDETALLDAMSEDAIQAYIDAERTEVGE